MRFARSTAPDTSVPSDARGSALKTALFFAYACAPYNRPESTIGAQRPAKFAKYLPQFGWRAIVICADARAKPIAGGHVAGIVDRALSELRPDASLIVP